MAIQRRRRGLFESTVQKQEPEGESRAPAVPSAPTHQQFEGVEEPEVERITVYATLDQLDHLDREVRRVRRRTRAHLPRTALIRGLVEGVARSEVDLATAGLASEAAVGEYVAGVLGGHARQGDEHSEEEPEAITVYLHPDHVDRLDEEVRRMRRATRKRLPRTALIRGVLEGFRRSGMDLAVHEASSEEQIAELVASRFLHPRKETKES